jgi:ABC-type multidrug transport system ATPase subunit
MKQKLALCCALIHKPKVLFLDEPTTGVDPVSRKEFWDMLKGLQAKGITILVSTPYMDEAALCDRVALMQNGHIMEIDSPKNIVQQYPKAVYEIGAVERHKLIQVLRYFPYLYSVYPFGEYVHYTDSRPDLDISELEEFLKAKGLTGIYIGLTEPTIEDVFMEMAKG